MSAKYTYEDKGDPSDFAPDFNERAEPYGNPVQEVLDVFNDLAPGSHILDVAGGYGRYAIPLIDAGFKVTIVDTHDVSLEEARRRVVSLENPAGELHVVKADVLREDIPDVGIMDAVLCIGFIHHLNNDGIRDLFKRMTESLRPDGRMVIELSTNKNRRYPSGEPILVDGVIEHNMTYDEGIDLIKELYSSDVYSDYKTTDVKLYERQVDFWYDADMIIAQGTKR